MDLHQYVNPQDLILHPSVVPTVSTLTTPSASSGFFTPSEAQEPILVYTWNDFLSAHTLDFDKRLDYLFHYDNNVDYEQISAAYWEINPFYSVSDASSTIHPLLTSLSTSPMSNIHLESQTSTITPAGHSSSAAAPSPLVVRTVTSPYSPSVCTHNSATTLEKILQNCLPPVNIEPCVPKGPTHQISLPNMHQDIFVSL